MNALEKGPPVRGCARDQPARGSRRLLSTYLWGACLLLGSLVVRGQDRPAFRQGAVAPRAEQPAFRNTGPQPVLDAPSNGNGPSGLDGVTSIPRCGYQTDQMGLSYSTLFRNTRFPMGAPIAAPPIDPSVHTESVRGDFRLQLPTITAGLPFLQRSFEPQDADFKAGPFFFKLVALQAAVLHSDNINQSPDNERESGTIAITTATINMLAQISEGLHLATSLTLVYFPIEGKAGIAGLNYTELYNLGLFSEPLTRAQVAWETKIGGWTVFFQDQFQISVGSYSDDYRYDYDLFDQDRFNEESRAGRYSFRTPGGTTRNASNDIHRDGGSLGTDFAVFSNEVSAGVDRLLPGTVRLQAQIYREDLWYNQGNRGLPSLREGAKVLLESQRYNTRFKPYSTYEAFRSEESADFQNIFRIGVKGPITDQLRLRAEYGYYFGGGFGTGSVWEVSLYHSPNPYIRHSLDYERTFSDFHDEIYEGIGYSYHQILGPKLTGEAFLYHLNVQTTGDVNSDVFDRNELRSGVRFTLTPGPKTNIRLSLIYDSNDQNNDEFWTGRLEIGYSITETVLARFLYQYRHDTSDVPINNYSENLFFLSLTKYFN